MMFESKKAVAMCHFCSMAGEEDNLFPVQRTAAKKTHESISEYNIPQGTQWTGLFSEGDNNLLSTDTTIDTRILYMLIV